MYKQKLCLGLMASLPESKIEQVKLIKNAGFDAVFAEWNGKGSLDEIAEEIKNQDLIFQSVHAFIGFEDHEPTAIGIKRFEKVVNSAEEKGIKIAFENTEGEEYLDALMEASYAEE